MWFYQENIWKKSEKRYQKNPTKSYEIMNDNKVYYMQAIMASFYSW